MTDTLKKLGHAKKLLEEAYGNRDSIDYYSVFAYRIEKAITQINIAVTLIENDKLKQHPGHTGKGE